MKVCVLNSSTQTVENIIELSESELENFVPYKSNIQLAPRHDGEIGWTWDTDSDSWITPTVPALTSEQTAIRVRQLRDKYLRMYVDTVNAVRWASLTAEQQTAIGNYRQQLLDVPSQPGFPDTVSWPTVPGI